jgi:YHS domain-containing protein
MKHYKPLLFAMFVFPLVLSCKPIVKEDSKAEENVKELSLEPSQNAAATASEKDPVCGMELKEAGPDSLVHESKTYHFCSASCKGDFEKDPKAFLTKK